MRPLYPEPGAEDKGKFPGFGRLGGGDLLLVLVVLLVIVIENPGDPADYEDDDEDDDDPEKAKDRPVIIAYRCLLDALLPAQWAIGAWRSPKCEVRSMKRAKV